MKGNILIIIGILIIVLINIYLFVSNYSVQKTMISAGMVVSLILIGAGAAINKKSKHTV